MSSTSAFEIKEGLYGNGVFLNEAFKEGDLIHRELPLVSSQYGNGMGGEAVVCHQCQCFLGPLSTQLKAVAHAVFGSPSKAPEVIAEFAPPLPLAVKCRNTVLDEANENKNLNNACEALFCSEVIYITLTLVKSHL